MEAKNCTKTYVEKAAHAVCEMVTKNTTGYKTPKEFENAVKNHVNTTCAGITPTESIAFKKVLHMGIRKACTTDHETFKAFTTFCNENPTVTTWLQTKTDKISRNTQNNGFLSNVMLGISLAEGLTYKGQTRDEILNTLMTKTNKLWPTNRGLRKVTHQNLQAIVYGNIKKHTLEIVNTVVPTNKEKVTNTYTQLTKKTVEYNTIHTNINNYVQALYK